MLVLEFLFVRQVQLGMLLAAFLFMPWNERKEGYYVRLSVGVASYMAITEMIYALGVGIQARLLIYTLLIFALIWFCFECSLIHNLFYTTCTYAVQHISSKFTYLIVVPISKKYNLEIYAFPIAVLLIVSILVAVVVFFWYTKPYLKKNALQFDNASIVIYSGVFLITAVYLSTLLEEGFDKTAPSYSTSYICLNAFCILFALAILTLNFNNCNIKRLKQENQILATILESDRKQYEQAKLDMEKINIRYHDIKQQYNKATQEEKEKLEEEMEALNLRYLTGNKAVDITLTEKSSICNKKGIQLVCSSEATCLSHMKHYHIYSMLGNALDNAIECLDQVQDEGKKVITLDIHKEKDMAVIRVENYTPRQPQYEDGHLISTKSNRQDHGYGVKSIQNTAELYGGIAHVFVENEIFYLVITLPCGEK